MRLRELTNEATGLSPATLSSYKKKASAEASALDKEAFEKGGPDAQAKLGKAHKRYKGINKATQKQFDNDAKGIVEMDSQGYTGSREGSDPDAGKKEYRSKAVKAKDVAKQGLSHLHKALDRALSKEKKASPAQQQRNKERWAKRQAERKKQGVAEGSEERSQKRLWAQITDYEQRAKATKNDIKRDHYLKMASELRGKLKTTDDVEESQVNEISTKLRDKYVTRATDDYGHANFAARASKSHPGLEKYSQEQETRAKKRAAGLNRALSDKRLGRVEESNDNTVSFEVDSERAYNHIMDKFGHVIEWDGDAMVIPSKYWSAVQELAYAAGGEATEYNTVDEASLATMRDYFAGDENAKDEMKITQMRKYYANDAAKEKTKNFNSLASYHQWLKQVGAEKINRK
jgi:hypothetical protein